MMAKPWLKWVGGKGRKVDRLGELLPSDFASRVYVEPMVGGGATFFEHGASARRAVLADVNERLIRAYRGVQSDPEMVILELAKLGHASGVEHYLKIREEFNAIDCATDDILVAALFTYVNRMGFNGLYRENASGKFNVPWGKKNEIGVPGGKGTMMKIRSCSIALKGVDLRVAGVASLIRWCPEDAFIYLDPPYVTKRMHVARSGFSNYSKDGFDESDLRVVSRVAKLMSDRGAKVMVSHSDVPVARDVFGWMNMHSAVVGRSVSRSATGRVDAAELVFTSY